MRELEKADGRSERPDEGLSREMGVLSRKMDEAVKQGAERDGALIDRALSTGAAMQVK